MKKGYIPKDQRKKILLITDDIRMHSGVGSVGRELVLHTAHHFNWVNLGGAINHPDKGKRFDLSQETDKQMGLEDSSVFVYPIEGYSNAEFLRNIINMEQPDAIFLITDPRYFVWLFEIENEIRARIPIVYLNIWDDLPAPLYNRPYYESCDALLAISKQTKNINELVLGEGVKNKIIEYVPHGINTDVFFPVDKEDQEYQEFIKKITKGREYDFVMFFNSRNIRRKQIQDALLSFKLFLDSLPKEKAEKCLFILNTQPIDENGTNLFAVIEYFFGKDTKNILISGSSLAAKHLNYLYNYADVQILTSSAEGWGLSLTEALVTGTPIIGNVTGGIQDQMRFEDENGNWINFSKELPSNHTGKYKKCGEWAFPVFPNNRSLVGSIPTPYIYETRCSIEDTLKVIKEVYSLGKEELKRRGLKGREWALGDESGFTAVKMGEKVISSLDKMFSTWKPKERYEVIKFEESENLCPHNLSY